GNFDFAIGLDFVDRRIVVTPRSPLLPGAQYNLDVGRLVALDGSTLSGTVVGAARAGSDVAGLPAAAATPTWNGTVAALIGGCAPACHSPLGASGDTRTPTRSLDLTGDPRDPTFGLIGVYATGLAGSARPLLRVAPGDAARSALLR